MNGNKTSPVKEAEHISLANQMANTISENSIEDQVEMLHTIKEKIRENLHKQKQEAEERGKHLDSVSQRFASIVVLPAAN